MRLGEKELLVSKYITNPICLAAIFEAECRQTCNGVNGMDNLSGNHNSIGILSVEMTTYFLTCVLPEDDGPGISVS